MIDLPGIVNALLHTKEKNILTNVEDESVYVPFVVNRWISMHSPKTAKAANEINRHLSTFGDKKELYKLHDAVIPKVPKNYSRYIKKEAVKKIKPVDNLDKMAQYHEVSKREIKEWIDYGLE